ncbi:DUF3574 domain-containing protein [Streptomyces sp. N2A]|uniref:DUF3574 domain-containing protein n=1 Tax=Streptomyces sp. N2A TaxID=3073936 RepID=UPI00287076BC|nr:DUF3574 domain-containing protein [Streptomyces sp. N2A]
MPVSPKLISRTRVVAVTLLAAVLGGSGPVAYAALDGQGASPAAQPAHVTAAGEPYIKTELLFGTAKPDGGPPVTDRQFRAFVDSSITPRFPAGLTVEDSYGQYRDRHGKIERERSHKVTLLYPTRETGPDGRKIDEIRSEYNRQFQQESVARIDDRELVDF